MEVWEGIVITIIIGWAGWVSIFLIQTNTKANKSLSNDEFNQKEINAISSNWKTFEGKFSDMEKSMKEGFRETNNRLDVFIKNELDTLKSIAQK